jgi:hypothetical protein
MLQDSAKLETLPADSVRTAKSGSGPRARAAEVANRSLSVFAQPHSASRKETA